MEEVQISLAGDLAGLMAMTRTLTEHHKSYPGSLSGGLASWATSGLTEIPKLRITAVGAPCIGGPCISQVGGMKMKALAVAAIVGV